MGQENVLFKCGDIFMSPDYRKWKNLPAESVTTTEIRCMSDEAVQTKLTRPFKIYIENAPPEKDDVMKSGDDFEKTENAVADSKSLAEVFTAVSEGAGDEGSAPDSKGGESFAELFKSISE